MKIAKKLLAAIVALMVVCSLTVSAFAADPSSYDDCGIKLVSDWTIDEYNCITVDVYFTGAEDLKSFDLVLTYDANILGFVEDSTIGSDAAQVNNTKTNAWYSQMNGLTDGLVTFAGYFQENMYSAEKFASDAKRGETVSIDPNNFHAFTFYLNVDDAAALASQYTEITVEGAMKFGVEDAEVAKNVTDTINNGYVDVPATDVPATDAPATDAPATDAPATDAPATDAPATDAPATDAPATDAPATDAPATDAPATDAPATNPLTPPATEDPSSPIGGGNGAGGNGGHGGHGKPGHDHPNTGNSAVLAAAAGVVLLAGAAFVVTKKRK